MNINPATFPANRSGSWVARSFAVSRCQAKSRTVCLQRGEVLRLEKASGIKNLTTRMGVLWLTDTPATADVLLKDGGQFKFKNQWPYLIEALEQTELVLFPA